jgi:hypothetical protein
MQSRLAAIKPASVPVDQRVDYALVKAQLDGMDFDLRVLKPFARDPAYYQSIWTEQSDTPAHEGPINHAIIDLWTYAFPLSPADQTKLAGELATIPPLLAQARVNLVGNAKGPLGHRHRDDARTGGGSRRFRESGGQCQPRAQRRRRKRPGTATEEFVAWLRKMAPAKTGPVGHRQSAYTRC